MSEQFESDALALLTGQVKTLYVGDTTARTGAWRRMRVVADAVVTYVIGGQTVTSATITAATGDIYGSFTAVTLASGAVILYT
jgi:hypothetical protein